MSCACFSSEADFAWQAQHFGALSAALVARSTLLLALSILLSALCTECRFRGRHPPFWRSSPQALSSADVQISRQGTIAFGGLRFDFPGRLAAAVYGVQENLITAAEVCLWGMTFNRVFRRHPCELAWLCECPWKLSRWAFCQGMSFGASWGCFALVG